jgi:hypothetical protein
MPTITTRTQWGARHRAGYGPRTIGNLNRYLHHTVTKHLPADATVAAECAQMRIIEDIGQQRFGTGISYTFIIFPSGRIYEGAGIGRVSAHSGKGRNTSGAGLCLAGNYETHALGDQARTALVWLLQHGVVRGWWKTPTITEAHRDFKNTSCPGKYAYAAITRINTEATTSRTDTRPGTTTGDPGVVAQQRILATAGYYGGLIDGVPGPMFRAAVKAYQDGQVFPDLVADGHWGPVTDRHAHWTRDLQVALNEWSAKHDSRLTPLRVDYDYGDLTARRVLDFQVRNHGKAYPSWATLDGEAGALTVKALGLRAHP